MGNGSFEDCLVAADATVRQGDWEGAIRSLKLADQIQPGHIEVLTALGTCHIQLERAGEAVSYFQQVAALAPEVFEAHNNLGVAYTLTGNYAQAEQAYRRALEIDGENTAAWKNLAQACLQQNERVQEGVQILASLVQAHPEDPGALVMMGNVYEEAGDLGSAETLFHQAQNIDLDNPDAGEGLKRVAEIRARQARIARPEHAKKLAALKSLRKAASEPAGDERPALQPVGPFPAEVRRVTFYAPEDTQAHIQAGLLARRLSAAGRMARVSSRFEAADLPGQDLVVFSQPILSGEYIQAIQHCMQEKRPFAVAIDQDFHHIPQDHPAYTQYGPGNPGALRALETMLEAAQFVIVPTPLLAERYQPYSQQIAIIPPAIDLDNPLWKKPHLAHPGFRIGWIGSAADQPDLMTIRKVLLSFLRATPEAVLVIAGDEGAYARFNAIDESRRLFLPAAGPEEIPYLLGQFDLLIVPLRDNPYNQARSALPLMEAEARGIPWVATQMPGFAEMQGGVLVETVEEWERAMRSVVS